MVEGAHGHSSFVESDMQNIDDFAYDLTGELFLRERWRELAGLPRAPIPQPKTTASLDELQETEWSPTFEKLMRNRLIMGALRYGRLHQREKPVYDRMSSIAKRRIQYLQTGNKELLVDIANLALLEFEEGNGYFAAIDDGAHVADVKEARRFARALLKAADKTEGAAVRRASDAKRGG